MDDKSQTVQSLPVRRSSKLLAVRIIKPQAQSLKSPSTNVGGNMATRPKRNDIPANRDANPDAITGEPGSHPVGAGLGAAAGGAAAGAAAGVVGGPVGAAVGAVVGGIAGGLAGKGVAEQIDPTQEDAYWRANTPIASTTKQEPPTTPTPLPTSTAGNREPSTRTAAGTKSSQNCARAGRPTAAPPTCSGNEPDSRRKTRGRASSALKIVNVPLLAFGCE